MAKTDAADNLRAVAEQNERDAKNALQSVYARMPVQTQLFEAWAEQKPVLRKTHGYTLADETYARLRASGYNQTESWRLSHPKSAASLSTCYSKASRLEKQDKIQARIKYWKERIASECLMSTTELFARLSEMARKGGKDAKGALELIGKIHGVFNADKGLPGGADNPLVVQVIDFRAGAQEREKE